MSYIDKTTGTEQQVRCRTVVLSAAACESARLLLNSKSSRHPQGLANENGQVGKYLTDTVGFGMSAQVPALAGTPVFNSDGYGAHLYIPWWMLDRHKELDFPRGYHVEVGGGGFGMPGLGFGAGTYNRTEGYGLPMKKAIRESYGGTTVSLSGRGAMVPNEDCFCEIDPDVKDKWGIPVLRFHWKWSDYEINQVKHMRESFRAILETIGGTVNPPQQFGPPAAARPTTPGAPVRPRSDSAPSRRAADGRRRRRHPRSRLRAHGRRSEDQRARTRSAAPTTCRTCSSPTAGRSSATPTRTRPTRSSRWRGAPPSTSPRS